MHTSKAKMEPTLSAFVVYRLLHNFKARGNEECRGESIYLNFVLWYRPNMNLQLTGIIRCFVSESNPFWVTYANTEVLDVRAWCGYIMLVLIQLCFYIITYFYFYTLIYTYAECVCASVLHNAISICFVRILYLTSTSLMFILDLY